MFSGTCGEDTPEGFHGQLNSIPGPSKHVKLALIAGAVFFADTRQLSFVDLAGDDIDEALVAASCCLSDLDPAHVFAVKRRLDDGVTFGNAHGPHHFDG